MTANTNPTTGIRYGVIAFNNLDPDLGQELWYTHGRDLSYEAAMKELRAELEREADGIEEEARIAAEEVGGLTDREREGWIEARIEHDYGRLGFDDRQDFIEQRIVERTVLQDIGIEEPVIEGEYAGVKYRIDWLGGAPLLWVFEGPVGRCNALCSPCVPNAGDLDSGFFVPGEGGDSTATNECYCVPRDWLRGDFDSEGGEA